MVDLVSKHRCSSGDQAESREVNFRFTKNFVKRNHHAFFSVTSFGTLVEPGAGKGEP